MQYYQYLDTITVVASNHIRIICGLWCTNQCLVVWFKSCICRTVTHGRRQQRTMRKLSRLCYDEWTHPEDPVLLQTPSRGLFSAKLSVFKGSEEVEESEEEADEKQKDQHTTKRDILSMNMWGLKCCPPSFNRQPITMTGNVLITLLLLPYNSIMVTKHFWWRKFFFSQIRPYLGSESTKMSTVFQRKLKIMGGKTFQKKLLFLSCCSCWFFCLSFLFVLSFQGGITAKKKKQVCLIKTCFIRCTDPVFFLIVPYLRRRGSGDWGDGLLRLKMLLVWRV